MPDGWSDGVRRRARRIRGNSSTQSIAWAALPFLIIAAVYVLLGRIGEWNHSRRLPDGYEHLSEGAFEVYYPPGREMDARAVVAAGVEFLERLPTAWQGRLGDLEPPVGPFRLTLFANSSDFTEFASDTLSEDLSHNGGYFDVVHLEIVLVLSELDQDNGMGIRHELAHLLLARGGGRMGTRMPSWLNEGLAMYLETAGLTTDAAATAPVQALVQLIALAKEAPQLETLLQAENQRFSQVDNDLYYAYSNLLVHYLIEAQPVAFWAYVRSVLNGGEVGMETFVEAFGELSTVEADWRAGLERARTRFAIGMGEYIDRGGSVHERLGPPSYRPFRVGLDAP